MTDNTWTEVFDPDTLEFRDSTQIGFVASRRIWHYEDMLSVEIEGQIVRHFGGQDNWEFNVPIALRWHPFPWDEWLDTSFAWGIGPSYATEVPEDEVAQHGESAQWLVHWFAELEFGPPESPWSGIVRLQHRSGAFGAVADDGGSNVWAVGLRRRY